MFSTDRSVLKMIVLGLLTFGIYPIVVTAQMAEDINLIAFPYDGKKTMSYALVLFVFTPLTLGIADLVWYARFSNRIKDELARRGIKYNFGARTFWIWYVLGSLISIGPIIYVHKLCKAVNRICADYNDKGE